MSLSFDDDDENMFISTDDENYNNDYPSVGMTGININDANDNTITLSNLPTEIIASIAIHLSRSSLAALSLTSQRLQSISERLLYTTVVVKDVLDYPYLYKAAYSHASASPSLSPKLDLEFTGRNAETDVNVNQSVIVPRKTQGLCKALSRRPHLAHCVRSLSIRWSRPVSILSHHVHNQRRSVADEGGTGRVEPPKVEQSFTVTLHSLLLSLLYLEHLELHLSGLVTSQSDPGFSFLVLLRDTSFRLRRLSLTCPVPPLTYSSSSLYSIANPITSPSPNVYSIASSISIEPILLSMPTLTHLHLPAHHPPLKWLSPYDLPVLQSFRGPVQCAASIIPGRPVAELALSNGMGIDIGTGYDGLGLALNVDPETLGSSSPADHNLLSLLSLGSCPVRKLDLSAMSITATQLLVLSKYFGRCLEVLRMRLALRHTLHFSFSGMMLLSALTHLLGSFPVLRALDLSPTSVDGIVPIYKNAREEYTLCSTWASVVPSLKWVRFPSGTIWKKEEEWEESFGGGRMTSPTLSPRSNPDPANSSSSSMSPRSGKEKEKGREVESRTSARWDDANYDATNRYLIDPNTDNTSKDREKSGGRGREMDVDGPEFDPSSSSNRRFGASNSDDDVGGGVLYGESTTQSTSNSSNSNDTGSSANASTNASVVSAVPSGYTSLGLGSTSGFDTGPGAGSHFIGQGGWHTVSNPSSSSVFAVGKWPSSWSP